METRTNHIRPARSLVDRYAEVSRYFMRQGSLNTALAKLAQDLREHDIDYMVIGALALFEHGYARLTEDIDLVLTPEGLEVFHRELIGLGYLPAFRGARKRLRSTVEDIAIDVIITGEYPGDGKPKPVSIPDPATASIEIEGVRFVNLEKLIELKLASGMTAPHRLKDLADVQEMIKVRNLQSDFAEKLDPYVRSKFLELCEAVQNSKTEEHS